MASPPHRSRRRLRAIGSHVSCRDGGAAGAPSAGWAAALRGTPAAAAAARVGGAGQPVLDLASLRVTQTSLRNDAQMTDLMEHIQGGGEWTKELDDDLPKVVRFEDGELFLRDGHHRCVASLAASRTTLLPSEYELEDWEYTAWSAPNFATGFITPYDPRLDIRVQDLTAHREAVAAALSEQGEAAAAEYVAAHPEGYLAPGGRAGRDTVSDLLENWIRDSVASTQCWVDECVAWNKEWQHRIAPHSADSSARAAQTAMTTALTEMEPHFPLGWHAANPLPPSLDLQSEQLREPAQLQEAARLYQAEGYLVIRNLLSPEEVEAAKVQLQGTIDTWPTGAPGSVFNAARESPGVPLVDIDPSVLSGSLPTPRARELAVRRVFRLAVHDPHFTTLVAEPRFTDLLAAAWNTEDISVLQSMALLKPPGTGEKFFHADQGYFRLYPSNVGAYWIALDDVTHENGAMHVVPRSHIGGTPKHTPTVSAWQVHKSKPLCLRLIDGSGLRDCLRVQGRKRGAEGRGERPTGAG